MAWFRHAASGNFVSCKRKTSVGGVVCLNRSFSSLHFLLPMNPWPMPRVFWVQWWFCHLSYYLLIKQSVLVHRSTLRMGLGRLPQRAGMWECRSLYGLSSPAIGTLGFLLLGFLPLVMCWELSGSVLGSPSTPSSSLSSFLSCFQEKLYWHIGYICALQLVLMSIVSTISLGAIFGSGMSVDCWKSWLCAVFVPLHSQCVVALVV